ncbi:l-ascorbate oxidase [Moniliophthora roreri]|nr:l-ascorbate oxidase [Moniliophthora roreri]
MLRTQAISVESLSLVECSEPTFYASGHEAHHTPQTHTSDIDYPIALVPLVTSSRFEHDGSQRIYVENVKSGMKMTKEQIAMDRNIIIKTFNFKPFVFPKYKDAGAKSFE